MTVVVAVTLLFFADGSVVVELTSAVFLYFAGPRASRTIVIFMEWPAASVPIVQTRWLPATQLEGLDSSRAPPEVSFVESVTPVAVLGPLFVIVKT